MTTTTSTPAGPTAASGGSTGAARDAGPDTGGSGGDDASASPGREPRSIGASHGPDAAARAGGCRVRAATAPRVHARRVHLDLDDAERRLDAATLDAVRTLAGDAVTLAAMHAFDQDAAAEADLGEMRVRFVGDVAMAAAHEQHCGVPGATDVITFDMHRDDPAHTPGMPPLNADVFVCVDEAQRQAADLGHDVARELALYVLHAALHCLGEDDTTPAAHDRMHAREDAIFRALGVGPVYQAGGHDPSRAHEPGGAA
jgi:rRNA maturation RNase YbeY